MEVIDKGCYSYENPKAAEHGISVIYNVHLDNISLEAQKKFISEMKELQLPIWLDLTVSDEVFF